jgi:hypothetical protein
MYVSISLFVSLNGSFSIIVFASLLKFWPWVHALLYDKIAKKNQKVC